MTTTTAKPAPFTVFRNRRFRLMWTSELVSTIGDSLVDIAAAILVYRITGSALAVGLVLVATAAPALLIGPFAGVFVDRFDRKRIMLACDLLRGTVVVLIPLLISFGIAWLFVAVVVVSAIGTFFSPAHASVLPEIAGDDELAAAHTMLAISAFASTALGFAAGGLIASTAPIEWAFYLAAATFFASAAIMAGVVVPQWREAGTTTPATVLRNLGAGIAFLWSRDVLRSYLVIAAGAALTAGLHHSLLLPFAVEALGASEFVFGLQEAMAAVGFVIGSLLVASRIDRLREGQWLTISLLGVGAVGVAYASIESIPGAVVLIMLVGFLTAPFDIAGRLIIQRHTTREIRGRVNSTFSVATNVAFLMGMALVGLADVIDVRVVFLATALATLALGVGANLLPGLRETGAQWRRAALLLQGAAAAPGLHRRRAATVDDLDALILRLPAMARFARAEARDLLSLASVAEAPTGTVIVRRGEVSDAAYFLITGRAVVGWPEGERRRPLETLNAGDFFGEIAALTGAPRTADVVADDDAMLLQVPSRMLRRMAADPALRALFGSTMRERMLRMDALGGTRLGGLGEAALKELRTDRPPARPENTEPGVAPQATP